MIRLRLSHNIGPKRLLRNTSDNVENVGAVGTYLMLAAGAGALVGLTTFGVISLGEGERRAARVSFMLAAAISVPCFAVAALPPPAPLVGAAVIATAMAVLVVLSLRHPSTL